MKAESLVTTTLLVLFAIIVVFFSVLAYLNQPSKSTTTTGNGAFYQAEGLSQNIGIGAYDVNNNLLQVVSDQTPAFALYQVNNVPNVYSIKISGQICSVGFNGWVMMQGASQFGSDSIENAISSSHLDGEVGILNGNPVAPITTGQCVNFVTDSITLDIAMSECKSAGYCTTDSSGNLKGTLFAWFRAWRLTAFDPATSTGTVKGTSTSSNTIHLVVNKNVTGIDASISLTPTNEVPPTTTTIVPSIQTGNIIAEHALASISLNSCQWRDLGQTCPTTFNGQTVNQCSIGWLKSNQTFRVYQTINAGSAVPSGIVSISGTGYVDCQMRVAS